MPNRQHVLRLESDALAALHVEVAHLEGREAVGSLFELEITLVTKDPAGLPVDDLVGADARLVFELDGREVRRLGGMIAGVDDLLDPESRFATYRALFVPRAYRLTQRETLDVHLDQSEPELFAKKLEEIGLAQGEDFELRLVDVYPKRELVVQYRETDLAFVSRLAEHLGISFWVEAREGRDVVVFSDRNEGFSRPDPDVPVPFRPRGDGRDVYALEQRSRVVPTKHVVRDYNYRNPGLDLTATAELEGGSGSVVEYGAHFKDPAGGARFARIRLEEQLCRSKTFRGKSDLPGLVVGSRVVLEGHPRGDIDLIVVEVAHRGDFGVFGGAPPGGRAYENDFVAIRADIPFRPARVTPKPRVHGVMTGVVDGAGDSGYAQIDEEGRYRVKFMFDTADRDGGQASRPIRMAQPHAGEGYGMHFPLRAGVEVIITCVDGDPDRPIIAGTVPNPATPSPVASANGTRNVIRTGGGNQIDMDDTDGAQRIKLSSPRMNTVFQLGEPNAPELGAILSTSGASTTIAQSGSGLLSSFDTSINTIQSYKDGGDVTTVASKAGKLDKALLGLTLADTIAGGLNTAYDAVQAGATLYFGVRDSILSGREGESSEKQAALDAQQLGVDAAETALLADLKKQGREDEAQNLETLGADYDKSCTDTDEAQEALDDAEDALADAQRKGLSTDSYGALLDAAQKARDEAVAARDAAQGALDAELERMDRGHVGAAGAVTAQKLKGAGRGDDAKKIEDAGAAYDKACSASDDAQKAVDSSGKALADAEKALADAVARGDADTSACEKAVAAAKTASGEAETKRDAAVAARVAALATVRATFVEVNEEKAYPDAQLAYHAGVDSHAALRADAKASKDAFRSDSKGLDDEKYAWNESTGAQVAALARFGSDILKTAFGTVSSILTLINTIKSAIAQENEATNWGLYGTVIRSSTPKMIAIPVGVDAKDAAKSKTMAWPVQPRSKAGQGAEWDPTAITSKTRATHTIGADDNMLVYGGRVLSLRSHSVAMLSANESTIYSAKDAALLSSTTVEVKGATTTYLGGKTIDALAGTTFKVVSGETVSLGIDPAVKASTTGASSTATPASLLEIKKAEASLKVGTTAAGTAAQIALTQQGKVAVDSKALELTIENAAKASAASVAVTATKSAKVEVSASSLELLPAKATLSKGDSAVLLSDAVAKLACGSDSYVAFSAAAVNVKGTNINFDATGAVKVNGKNIQIG